MLGFATAGLVAFVCVLYHAEHRYFAPLIPLVAVVVSGAIVRPVATLFGHVNSHMRRVLPPALALTLIGIAASSLAELASIAPEEECLPVYEWIRESTPSTARVLGVAPAKAAWYAERAGIMLPSGDVDDLVAIARRYDVEWLVSRPVLVSTSGTVTAARVGRSGAPPLNAVKVVGHRACTLYRLHLPSG